MDTGRDVFHTVNLSITLNLVSSAEKRESPVYRENLDNPPTERNVPSSNEHEHHERALQARFEEHQTEHFLMNKKPKGKVLLINNDFKTHDGMQTRIGCQVDEDNLKEAFESLGGTARGYEVDVNTHRNLSAEKTKEYVELFASEVTNLPSFVAVVIMSHGEGGMHADDFVIGNDGNPCFVEELVEAFKSQPAWRDIPVLMFFQMCRGSGVNVSPFQEVTPVRVDQLDSAIIENVTTHSSEGRPTRATLRARLQAILPGGKIIGTGERTPNDQAGSELPGSVDGLDYHSSAYVGNAPNTLISFSSSEGQASILNPNDGSWYIQELCKAIKAMSKERHLVEIMEEVHIGVSGRRSQDYRDIVMACDSSHSFQKKLAFFPGYPKN